MPEPTTAEPTLAEVLARLAKVEARLDQLTDERAKKDWRRTIGMFDGDPAFMREVIAEGAAIREAERLAARAEVTE